METIQLEKKNLVAAYNSGTESEKRLLETLYGKQHFGSIIDRVTTIEDACRELGIDPDDRHDDCADEYKEVERDIEIFAEALREGKPASECFYYPYFRSSGGGFSFHDCGRARVFSFVGARLRVDTPEKATHLGKCMLAQYKVYHND
ncbi:hypothetical protein ACTJIJ_22870 [Niabella sp. 22666]|uniref:hypothetical protein n=1 Tax=Niabella sp. 22666 TaxID=3453954 RepID=UPI003F85D9F3